MTIWLITVKPSSRRVGKGNTVGSLRDPVTTEGAMPEMVALPDTSEQI